MAKKKLLIAAIIVGFFAGFLLYLYGKQIESERDAITANPHEVVEASRDIAAGTPLDQGSITTRTVPQQFLPANPLLARDIDIYLGRPVGKDITRGAMLLTSDFSVAETARTLAGRIPEGERAMTIPVDALSGVAGLLRPGDRVDIMGTFPVGQQDELIPEARGGESIGYVTMSLLQNVTLLAVGQEISDVYSDRGHRGSYANVTLSLTPDEAELMIIAQTRGNLTLLLRHRDDLEMIPVTRKTLREVLEDLEVINRDRGIRIEEVRTVRTRACDPGFRRVDGECIRDIPIIR